MKKILPIVEGDGDVKAVPELVRKIAHEVVQDYEVQVLVPHRRGDLPKVRQQFERWYQAALLEDAPILWVLDFDCKDCVDHEQECTSLLERARGVDPAGIVQFVFLVKEFESMFLHGAEELRSAFPELLPTYTAPVDPESIRDAKGWISNGLPRGRA